jgi:hypothetical protein
MNAAFTAATITQTARSILFSRLVSNIHLQRLGFFLRDNKTTIKQN